MSFGVCLVAKEGGFREKWESDWGFQTMESKIVLWQECEIGLFKSQCHVLSFDNFVFFSPLAFLT
jgi:hypothetical protein